MTTSISLAAFEPSLTRIAAPCWRIVPSRFPPVSLFDRVTSPEDFEAIFAIEALTNDRLRDELGDIQLVPTEDRVSGPGTTPIMAAFTHLNPDGARFTTAYFGAWYAGLNLATAIAETRYHRARFLSLTAEAPLEVDMRVYCADVEADLHDVRDATIEFPALSDPDQYGPCQAFGDRMRAAGSNGLVYRSVRHNSGQCVALYRPKLFLNCRQERHLTYRWNGREISDVYEKRAVDL